MTLNDKFLSFEEQITNNHTELVNKIDALLTALGAPPPTATVTLADAVTALTAINNNLIGMAVANGVFYNALLNKQDDILVQLAQLNTNTDLLITNSSLNAQRLLSAIFSTICPCETDAPVLAPPLDTTPTTLVDDAKCRRIQFYLALFSLWLNKIANYGSSAGFITGDVLGTLLSGAAAEMGLVATGAEVGAVGGIPGVVVGALVGLIVGAIAAFGGSVLSDYAEQYSAEVLQHDLLIAMYAATTADAGYEAFQSVIQANFAAIPAGIINALLWTQWTNDIYGDTPVVDDSAFDGSICAPPDENICHTYPFVFDGAGYGYAQFTNLDPSDEAHYWMLGDFQNYQIRIVSISHWAEIPIAITGLPGEWSGYPTILNPTPPNDTYVIPMHTTRMQVTTRYTNVITSGSIEVCPPGQYGE